MSEKLKHIIEKSGKKKPVSFKNKEKRIGFDEDFGKKKVDMVNSLIGSEENSKQLHEKFKSV